MSSDDRSIGLKLWMVSLVILAGILVFLYESDLANAFVRIALAVSLFCGIRGTLLVWKNPK